MTSTTVRICAAWSPVRSIVVGAALIASLFAILVAPPSALAGTQSFSDPAGDAPAGVPDVTSISVTPSADGTVYTFAVNLDDGAYTSDFFLDLYIDTTGDNVAEYLVRLLGNENRIEIDRWSGSAWDRFTASILEGTATLTPETIKLGSADIGGAQSFHFWLKAWKYVASSQPACCFDYAGVFAYTTTADAGSGGTGGGSGGGSGGGTRALPPPPPPPPFEAPGGAPSSGGSGQTGSSQPSGSTDKPTTSDTKGSADSGKPKDAIVSVAATAPKSIRVNRRFAVAVRVQGASTGRVACTVRVAGARVGVASATLRDGRASCTLRLPSGTRGKVARIVVDATAGTQTAHTALSRRIA